MTQDRIAQQLKTNELPAGNLLTEKLLIYMELLNFLTIIGVSADYKNAIQGVIIIVAVALTITRGRKVIAK